MSLRGSVGPNPIQPMFMKPLERRAELCAILALGLIRLRQSSERSDVGGESSLHFPPVRSGHATPTHRRTA
jgi:hypothetical protein